MLQAKKGGFLETFLSELRLENISFFLDLSYYTCCRRRRVVSWNFSQWTETKKYVYF